MSLYVDYAWQHPKPDEIYKDGYRGVLRYFSHDATKDLTAAEAKALHAAHLPVGVVWETTSTRAEAGFASGVADRREAEKRAAAIGYPHNAVIFYAVDADLSPSKVLAYFRGVSQGAKHPVGVYGSKRVVEAVHKAGYAQYLWQTQAWSGSSVSPLAHLYQRVKPTRPAIVGASKGSYDEDALFKGVPLWAPATAPAPKPSTPPAAPAKPTPAKPAPQPAPHKTKSSAPPKPPWWGHAWRGWGWFCRKYSVHKKKK